jgi:hypothetical protein
MKPSADTDKMAREVAKEIVAGNFCEYLPYFDILWNARDDPKRLGKTRGFEGVIVQQLMVAAFPFIIGVVSRIATDYIAMKVKPRSMDQTIRIVIDDAKAKNPQISEKIVKDLEKVLPQIIEKNLTP